MITIYESKFKATSLREPIIQSKQNTFKSAQAKQVPDIRNALSDAGRLIPSSTCQQAKNIEGQMLQ